MQLLGSIFTIVQIAGSYYRRFLLCSYEFKGMNRGFLGKDEKVSPCPWCVFYLLLDYTLFIACCIRDFKFFRVIYIEYLWFVYY